LVVVVVVIGEGWMGFYFLGDDAWCVFFFFFLGREEVVMMEGSGGWYRFLGVLYIRMGCVLVWGGFLGGLVSLAWSRWVRFMIYVWGKGKGEGIVEHEIFE
jgi:hypothetical protein